MLPSERFRFWKPSLEFRKGPKEFRVSSNGSKRLLHLFLALLIASIGKATSATGASGNPSEKPSMNSPPRNALVLFDGTQTAHWV